MPPTRLRSERDAAFRAFVEPELDVLLRVALRLTRHRADAEDLVQETVLRAWRALDRFDGRHPRAWLLTILRNANINRARKRRPDLFHDEDAVLGQLAGRGADGREGPGEVVVEGLPDQRVVAALRALSPKYREVVLLVDLDDLTYKEAAEVLDVPIGTVMSRLHRARRKVRDHLEESGWLREVPS